MTASIIPGVNLRGRKVLLIGGAGFIGHNLALRLRAHGAEVAILDSLQVNNLLSLHDTQAAPQERDLYAAMIAQRLHLLSEAGVPVEQFIFFSSSMVYGNFPTDSVDEESPCNPIGIYGAVKLGGEKLVAAYGNVFDLPYTNIRPSALYGQRCISRRVGQIFIENALRGKDLVIQGDGEDRIDFTYIDDLTQGVLRAMTTEAAKGQTFNMTYGRAHTLNEVADLVTSEFPGTSVRHIERSALVPERGTLDVSKARDLLGYEPSFPVARGFSEYIDWYRKLFASFPADHFAHVNAQANE